MVVVNIGYCVTFYLYWNSKAFALVSIAIILDFVFKVFYHTPQ
jgi:hypothetical protein